MAIAYVQDTGSTVTTGTTAAATFGTNPIVGNTVFGAGAHSAGGVAATSYTLSDTQSNTWTTDTFFHSTGDGRNIDCIIGSANVTSTGASFKITLTQNGGGSTNLCSTYSTYEFSGIATSSPFDSAGSATGNDTAGTTRTSPFNITGGTPAGGNELALMVYCTTNTSTSATSLTPNSGFTQNASNLTAAVNKVIGALSYNVIASVSGAQTFGESVAPTTMGSGSTKACSAFNLYKAAAAGGPTWAPPPWDPIQPVRAARPQSWDWPVTFLAQATFVPLAWDAIQPLKARPQWWDAPVTIPVQATFVPDNWWAPSSAKRTIADWSGVPPGVFQGVPRPPSTPPIDLWFTPQPARQRVILNWDSVPFVPTSAAVTITFVPDSFWYAKAPTRAPSSDWLLASFALSFSVLEPESWWAQSRGAQRAPDWWQFTGVLSSVQFTPQSWWDVQSRRRSTPAEWGQTPILPVSINFVNQLWWESRQFARTSPLAWTAVPTVPVAAATPVPFISQLWWEPRTPARTMAMPFDNINFSQKHILIPNPLYIGTYPGPYYVIGGPSITRKLQ